MDIGIPELLIILLVVILIFGPGRIMHLGKELGAGIRQFREGLASEDSTTPNQSIPDAQASDEIAQQSDRTETDKFAKIQS